MQAQLRFGFASIFAGTILVVTATRAAPPETPDPDPTYYTCQVERSGPYGRIWYAMEVPVDGTEAFHRINWQIPRRAEGLNLWIQWDGAPPVNDILDDRASVFVNFWISRHIREDMRIEIRREPGERYSPEFAYAGPYKRPYRGSGSQLYHVDAQGRLGDLRAWISGRDALTLALVTRKGAVMAEDRLAAATLADAANAIAAVRPEIQAMAADYRNRCEVPPPIVI